MNNFDIIYYINLEHRVDRKEQLLGELKKVGVDLNKVERINAVYVPSCGALGASLSHVETLKRFLATPDHIKNCLVLEDDFMFSEVNEVVNDVLGKVFREVGDFDVLMLSGNVMLSNDTQYDFLKKIIDCQTASGYCVSKPFASILLDNLMQSASVLLQTNMKIHDFCLDIYWKKLQPISKWYIVNPKLGIQRPSYSDIEQCNVEYNV